MAKAPAKTVQVIARRKGQKPDGTWAREGEVFEVSSGLVSRRWMRPVTAEERKAAASAAGSGEA